MGPWSRRPSDSWAGYEADQVGKDVGLDASHIVIYTLSESKRGINIYIKRKREREREKEKEKEKGRESWFVIHEKAS